MGELNHTLISSYPLVTNIWLLVDSLNTSFCQSVDLIA